MTSEQNRTLAKRNLVDSLWKEANLEGIAVTYPETGEIFEGRTVAGLTLIETKAINNLKHAWEFTLDTRDADIDLRYVRQLNKLIGQEGVIPGAGEIRQYSVPIGGTAWRPAIPAAESVAATLEQIRAIPEPTERALELFCKTCRGQWFNDGNKRTAQLAANAVLIACGCGILAIPIKAKLQFGELLIAYYETDNPSKLKAFLYEKAIDGANMEPTRGLEPLTC
ncbi:MAG: Fic family protein [Coriobacteriales bacterium]|nr:Fic family protein [Coriobacteriales bacterium]